MELERLNKELCNARETLGSQTEAMTKIESENKLLKRAITIQNQQKEQLTEENRQVKQMAEQVLERLKRAEQTNYALRVHLQRNWLPYPEQT